MFEAAKAKEAANSAELERPPDSETKDITETPPKEDLSPQATTNDAASCKKRKAEDAGLDSPDTLSSKKKGSVPRYHDFLAEPPPGTLSLFCKEDFRERFCRCLNCYPVLKNHPQLLEEEEYYEPPVSESGDEGGQSVGTGSLLDRGEAALSNMDRVRAIGEYLRRDQEPCIVRRLMSWDNRGRHGLQSRQRQSQELLGAVC